MTFNEVQLGEELHAGEVRGQIAHVKELLQEICSQERFGDVSYDETPCVLVVSKLEVKSLPAIRDDGLTNCSG